MKRQCTRSDGLPCASRGYQANGTLIVRPSTSSTTSVSSVTDTPCARASVISLGSGEVLIPDPQQLWFSLNDEPLQPHELGGPKTAATSQPYRGEPKLCSARLALDVNVCRLVPIGRVEEESVRTFPVDRRHEEPSVLVERRVRALPELQTTGLVTGSRSSSWTFSLMSRDHRRRRTHVTETVADLVRWVHTLADCLGSLCQSPEVRDCVLPSARLDSCQRGRGAPCEEPAA
jgi:hypothetical protein